LAIADAHLQVRELLLMGILRSTPFALSLFFALAACGGDGDGTKTVGDLPDAGGPITPPAASCAAGENATAEASEPQLLTSISDRWHEGWLASPAIADLDGDGTAEIVVARADRLSVWHSDGTLVWQAEVDGRIWTSPIVGDLLPGAAGLETVVASRDAISLYDASGTLMPGYPFEWRDELRSLAAADIDGDGRLEIVAVTNSRLEANGKRDILFAIEAEGAEPIAGFPPNTSGTSGCEDACYVTGGYDQNLALGDVNGDGAADIFATQDNAYLSLHEGDGKAFPAAAFFEDRNFFPGIRFLHDYDEAKQGYADDEDSANQAHFTNSAPAIADVDGDGQADLVVLGSVQNASQDDRERGVGLWVLHNDGTRLAGWETPFHAEGYLSGLWDFDGTNMVGATNQVSVVDLDPARNGLEMVFAGFDGRIHAVDSSASEMWNYGYTDDPRVLTGGVAVADLSGDGSPEIIFASYSPDDDKSHLFILGAGGSEQHKIALPDRGSMAVPTIADANGDGVLEIALAMKAGEDDQPQLMLFSVPGSGDACLLWATGRANLLRNGFVPPAQ
tara:strand:+ start:67687 stop:69372 length:1686 start_codon:yes stop_codon:yes gene_type:complete